MSVRVLRSQSETANWPRARSSIPSAMIFVKMDPRFGVASGRQMVPACQKLTPELGVLEELAIERDPN